MGKKTIILALLAILFASCTNPSRDAERYLRAHYPASSVAVHSVQEPRQLYTPFEVLNSLRLQVSSASSRKDLGKDFYDSYAETAQALQDLTRFADSHPEQCNRTGFSAFVGIDGRDMSVVFFYNRDGRTIGHTSLELMDSFSFVARQLEAFRYAD